MKAERTHFEKLDVYKLAEMLSDEVWTVAKGWDYFSKDTVGRQLIRAADSIGANIAEGTGRGSFVDNRRFARNARGSLNETRHWLRRAHKRGLLTDGAVQKIRPVIDELSLKLSAYLRSISQLVVKDTNRKRGTETRNQEPRTKN
jgi:four helix bundle protein